MLKFNSSNITIMLIYVITVMSSRSREQTLGSDNHDQNTSGSQPPHSNFPWDTKMKILNTTSIYTGVSWKSANKKWETHLNHNGKKYYGGYFDNEEHAAMKVNLLCDEYGIKRKNLTIDIELDVTPKIQKKTSKHIGVSWHSNDKKWQTNLNQNGKQYYGGLFDNEEHAASKENIVDGNNYDPHTSGSQDQTSNFPWDVKMKIEKKTSKYIGVVWNSNNKKWQSQLKHNGKPYYGGLFDDEQHAAMKINLLCDECGIKRKNSAIDIELVVIHKIQNKTSIYSGVSWHSNNKKWQTNLNHKGKKYDGGLFDNEKHAAMKINLLCDECGIKRKNSTIDIEPHKIRKIQNTTSLYTGVSWHSDNKKWQANLKHNGKQNYGGLFDNEKHAAMKINLLCDEYGIKRKNSTIDIEPAAMQKVQNTTSIYTGVSWNSDNKKWQTNLCHNKKQYYGGLFDNEEHAAMKINLLCDENGIKRKNLKIEIKPHVIQKIRNQTSNYHGVCWKTGHKKWKTQLNHNGKQYCGGYFDNEEHAAMKVNLLCDDNGIKRKNPTIDTEIHVIPKIKNTTSIYTGVSWKSENKKWEAQLSHNKKSHYGGYFDNEEHAAMRVNLLCDDNETKRKNLTIDIELYVTAPKIQKRTSKFNGVSWRTDVKKWQAQLKLNGKLYYGGLFDNEEHAAMKINLLCDKHGIIRQNLTIDIEPNVIQKKLKSKIDQSKKENIIKTEEESIRYGFKDQCENNFIKSEEKESHNDTAALCYKIQKRKRTKQLDYK